MRRAAIATVVLIGVLIGNLTGQATDNSRVAPEVTFDSAFWQKIIEKHLVSPKPLDSSSDAEFLAALSRAIKVNQKNAGELVFAARLARPQLIFQILRVGFRAAKTCQERANILFDLRLADPKMASPLLTEATTLAPDCADTFETRSSDAKAMMEADAKGVTTASQGGNPATGNFGNPPGINTGNFGNPPGLNGQGGLVAVCHHGQTIFLTPDAAARDLRNNPGDTVGACQVTPANNR